MAKKEKYPSIPLLQIFIGKEFEEELLKSVLIYMDKPLSQQPLGRGLVESLQKHVPNYKSLKSHHLAILKEHWLSNQEVYLAVLFAWKAKNESLLSKVSQWLKENQPTSKNIYTVPHEGSDKNDGILSKWADMFDQGHTQYDLDAIKLAMAFVLFIESQKNPFKSATSITLKTPLFKPDAIKNKTVEQNKTDENKAVKNEILENPTIWDSILTDLKKIPAEQFQLSEFEQFVERAHVIAEGKFEEQKSDQNMSAITMELQNIVGVLDSWGEYFKFKDHKNWSVLKLGLNLQEDVSSKFESLKNTLDELDGLRKSQSSSRDERLIRDQEVSKTEDKILVIYNELNAFLGNPSREDLTSAIITTITPVQVEVAMKFDNPSGLPETTTAPIEKNTGSLESSKKEKSEAIVNKAPVVDIPVVVDRKDENLKKEYSIAGTLAVDFGIPGTENANHALLSNIVEGNLPRAYWIALAQEQQNREPSIPSWMISGVQGTHWFMSHWPDMPQGLLGDIRETIDPKSRTISPDQSVFALSIALGLSLLESGVGLEEWLSVDIPPTATEINHLLNEVEAFTLGGNKLEPFIVHNFLGKEQVESRIKDLSKRAADWLDQAPQKGGRFPGADDVWKKIVGSKGTLHSWFDLVAQDKRKSAQEVLAQLDTWGDRPWLDNYIQKLNREIRGGAKSIDGEARNQLIFRLLKAVEIAQQWSALILETNIDVGSKRWLWEQTTHFCDFLKKNLPKSIAEAKELQAVSLKPMERVSYAVLEVTLHLLAVSLGVVEKQTDTEINKFLESQTLQENLAKVLIYYPELTLTESGFPEKEMNGKELAALVNVVHTEREAFDLWLEKKNYSFLNTLIDYMPDRQDEARRKMGDQLADDIQRAEDEADKTIVSIEQAMVDDLVAEQDYVAASSTVASVRKYLKSISLDGSRSVAPNMQILFTSLAEIREKIETSHNDRLNNFRHHWEELSLLLPKVVQNDDDRSKVVELVNRNLEQKDLRAVAEIIAHLDDVITGNHRFALELFSSKNTTYKVLDFNQEIMPMFRALDNNSTLQQEGERFGEEQKLPSDRRREIQEALIAWQKLKKDGNKDIHSQNFSHVITIMQYLGWDVPSTGSPISVVSAAPANFQHWHVMANPRVPSPVPQFGSDRMKETSGQVGYYDVVGAWARPGFDSIDALINDIGKKPFIMLYFGRLVPAQRAELIKLARKKQHQLIVVDELLMLFLAKEYQVRLSAMFDCSLPYSSVNPYTPFATGSVPPEMYFGREDKLGDLEDPYGPSIVYGGRQLGKSALLRQVQRNFHNPERGQFAIYEDIRLIGDPMSGKDYKTEIAERLVNALRKGGVIEQSKQSIDIFKLSELLISQIKSNGWRVILLIDEADMFLEADAGTNFSVVTALKRVMDQTDRMFKVVFAGLHHVQQFTKTSNQPLAHLGASGAIKIGPLEPISAIELIEKPLRSLGYVFGKPEQEDTSLIAHILSYTNYHPGLLQLFGQSLVDHLNQKSYGTLQPPYSITRSDIEAVYRSNKVRDMFRDRFNITLALDERYEAITLSLILEQWDEKNGFNRLFTPEELLKISRGNWISGFGDDAGIFKGFLDEMCGLGVLSSDSLEDGNDKYRLRSPNLVSLMGDEGQIINRLDVISKSQPMSPQRKLESYHAPVDSYYSSLTYAQERVIAGSSSGVCMVFGTEATRINNLSDILKKTAESIGDWSEIKVSAKTESTLREQLKGVTKKSDKPVFAYRELDGTPEEMAEQVITAARFCLQTRDKKIRVVFSLDALSAWKWFQIPLSRRTLIEQDYVDVVVTLDRWDKLGIRQLLEQHEPEIPAGDANIKKIYETTGGWPNLMDKFIDLCRGSTDPLPALEELKKLLLTESERSRFISDLGLYDSIHIKEFLESVLKENDLKSLTSEECLDYLFDKDHIEQAQVVMEYLRRLAIIQTMPYIQVEPVVAKLWYEPKH